MANAEYESFEDNRIKHLEMIQAVIARLGNDSFLVKGWALTVAGAFFGFAINATKLGLAWASLVPTVLFWGLDVHFLRAERLFRVLFEYVRKEEDAVDPFFMNAPGKQFVRRVKADRDEKNAASWWNTLKRPTLALFYGTLIIAAVVLILLIETRASVLQSNPLSNPAL